MQTPLLVDHLLLGLGPLTVPLEVPVSALRYIRNSRPWRSVLVRVVLSRYTVATMYGSWNRCIGPQVQHR